MKTKEARLNTRAKNLLRRYPSVGPEFYGAIPGVGVKLAQRMRELTAGDSTRHNDAEGD